MKPIKKKPNTQPPNTAEHPSTQPPDHPTRPRQDPTKHPALPPDTKPNTQHTNTQHPVTQQTQRPNQHPTISFSFLFFRFLLLYGVFVVVLSCSTNAKLQNKHADPKFGYFHIWTFETLEILSKSIFNFWNLFWTRYFYMFLKWGFQTSGRASFRNLFLDFVNCSKYLVELKTNNLFFKLCLKSDWSQKQKKNEKRKNNF